MKTKKYVTKDYTGKKHVYAMPEFKVMPWERGGLWDLSLITALGYIIYLMVCYL